MIRRSDAALRLAAAVAFACALPPGLRGQGDVPDLPAESARVTAATVAAMHARADALAAQKQNGRAVALRRQILLEWAPGDATALTALGFVQDGGVWRRDADKLVLEQDLDGDKKVIKRLDQDWARTLKTLIRDVERLALAFEAGGDKVQALVWWRRLLLLKPDDKRATAQLDLHGFDGQVGTAEELELLRHGRAIAQIADYVRRMEVPVAPQDGEHPLLAKAGVAHHGVRSEHFAVWGTLPVDKLVLCAESAERGLLLSRALFGTYDGEVFRPREVRNLIWVESRETYKKVLEGCRDQFPAERLRFLADEVELAYVDVGSESQRLYLLTTGGDAVLQDQSVRGAVQDATKFASHGLWEGIGHAACGILFDRTLTFFVEQRNARTVTSWKPRPLMPDLETWRQIAAESAWARSDTKTSQLVLLHANKFTNEERVKAWAMTDYLLRLDPRLLLRLDACKDDKVTTDADVERAFERLAGRDLGRLDDDWRDYWGKGQSLRTAMAAPPQGDGAAVTGARKLADAVCAARAAAEVGPLGFVVATGADARAALQWMTAVARFERDQKAKPNAKPTPPPEAPAALGRTVLLATGVEPAAAVARWLVQPVLRDALLHPGRRLIGCSSTKDAQLVDLGEGAESATHGLPLPWPRDGQRGVPRATTVAALGPGFVGPLEAAGRGPDDAVGTPLTLHFWRDLSGDDQREITCQLRADGRDVQGVLVSVQDLGGASAPGCYAFVPLAPLPAGRLTVTWTVPHRDLPRSKRWPAIEFSTDG